MSRITLIGRTAIIAIACTLGGAALAQKADNLPAWLHALDLQNMQTEQTRRGGQEVEGRLAGGGKIEALFDKSGNLIEIDAEDVALPQPVLDAVLPQILRDHDALDLLVRAQEIQFNRDRIEIEGYQQNGEDLELEFDSEGHLLAVDAGDTPLPQSLIDTLLPQAVLASDVLDQLASIHEIRTHDNTRFRVEGRDNDSKELRLMVDQDGRLLRFGREDGRRKGPGGWQDRHRGPGKEAFMRPDAPDHHWMQPGARGGKAPALEFDPVEVNQRLTEAGYSGFGLLYRDGPRLVLDAQNPAGEAVTLQLDRQGEVIRETAR